MIRYTLIILAAVGCVPPSTGGTGSGAYCTADSDCASGESCARTNECVTTGDLLTVRVSWTIGGVTPTPQDPSACAGIDHLAVGLVDSAQQSDITYSPVPCTPPLITFNKMPPRFDVVTVEERDSADYAIRTVQANIPAGQDASVMVALPPN